MSKKGISDIVATVLIVLITIAAIGMVWTMIIPLIRTGMETSRQCLDAALQIDRERFTSYNPGLHEASVRVGAEAGIAKVKLVGIQLVVAGEKGGSKSYINRTDLPSANEFRVYKLNWTATANENAASVSVAPIIKIGDVENICRVADEAALQLIQTT